MKKILFVEGLSNHVGHKKMNKLFMEIFMKKYEVHTICFSDWYFDLSPNIIQHFYIDTKEFWIKKLTRTFSSINILTEIKKLDKKLNFDIIIMSTFSYWVTPLWPFFFRNYNKMWILHHDDLDLSRRYPYKIFFYIFVKRYVHLTLDSFIKKGMMEWYPGISDRIFELIHPHERRVLKELSLWKEYQNKFLCISIGRGASDEFFSEIISLEEKKHILKKNNVYLYLKSSKIKYENENIIVNPNYLSEQEYNELLGRASVLFVCYNNNYHLRVSGQLLDGISNYKYVIGNDIQIVRAYEERYPDICKAIITGEDFLNQLILLKRNNYNEIDFKMFFKDHSDEKILKQMNQIEKIIFR